MTSTASVEADERLRLFLALRLPDEIVAALDEWAGGELDRGRRVPREHLHVTLAFLGSRPADELPGIVGALRKAAAAGGAFPLEPVRYRETRSVGMVVLDDPTGGAGALAADLHDRLEELLVYRREARRWLPHVTVLRFRERPRLHPPLPALGTFVPSDAAVFLSRLHPSGARYEVLESVPLRAMSPKCHVPLVSSDCEAEG
jgi:RNA 2',3'-cyclic 3'-phosphodiesterase